MSKLDAIQNPCEKHASVTVTGEACVSCMFDRISELESLVNAHAALIEQKAKNELIERLEQRMDKHYEQE